MYLKTSVKRQRQFVYIDAISQLNLSIAPVKWGGEVIGWIKPSSKYTIKKPSWFVRVYSVDQSLLDVQRVAFEQALEYMIDQHIQTIKEEN